MKSIYVSINKPLEIKKFEKNNAPMGWYRFDILQKHIKDDIKFKQKFSKEELKIITKLQEERELNE